MSLPFSREQFFEVFGQYNSAIWPAQIGLVAMALACLAMLLVQKGWDRAIGWMLAVLWAWMAIAYHLVFFSPINPAARLFGAAFLLAAGLFAWHAHKGTLRFSRPRGAACLPGLLLIAYALVGYPLVGLLAGHTYPRTPTFGLPCPTTIFTIGLLLLAQRPAPVSVFVVPLAWAVVGTTAALRFGVPQDYGLVAAGVIAVATFVRFTVGEPSGGEPAGSPRRAGSGGRWPAPPSRRSSRPCAPSARP